MKFAVKLFVGGKVFNEEVQAVNRDNAIDTAKARNPHARVIGVNPLVKSWLCYHLLIHHFYQIGHKLTTLI